MAEAIVIPAALRDEIAADLEAGGERAARWRPGVETDHEVLIAGCTCDAPTNHDGHVGPATHDWLPIAASTDDGQGWTSLSVDAPQVAQCEAVAWAPVGGVDGGPRPEPGHRLLARHTPMRVHNGRVGVCRRVIPDSGAVIAEFNPEHPAEQHLRGDFAVTEWVILPPALPVETPNGNAAELEQANGAPTELVSPHRETGRAVRDAGGIPPGPWRVGSQCGRNLWIGPPRPDGVDIGRVDNDALAAHVVAAVNNHDRYREALEAIHAIASDTDDPPDRLSRSPHKQLRAITRSAAEALDLEEAVDRLGGLVAFIRTQIAEEMAGDDASTAALRAYWNVLRHLDVDTDDDARGIIT